MAKVIRLGPNPEELAEKQREIDEAMTAFGQLNSAFVKEGFNPTFYTFSHRWGFWGVQKPEFSIFAINPETHEPDLFFIDSTRYKWYQKPYPTLAIVPQAFKMDDKPFWCNYYAFKKVKRDPYFGDPYWETVHDTKIYNAKYPSIQIPPKARPNSKNTGGLNNFHYLAAWPDFWDIVNYNYVDPGLVYLQKERKHEGGSIFESHDGILGEYLSAEIAGLPEEMQVWYARSYPSGQKEMAQICQLISVGELNLYLEQTRENRVAIEGRDPYIYDI